MKLYKKIYLLIALICICILLLISIKDNSNSEMRKNIKMTTTDVKSEVKNDKYNKLMIVAHPDDETIWGGANLIEDDYVVVCVTCGVSDVRSKEFKKVMEITNDKYIMLGYPDVVNGEISDWRYIYDSIENNLKNIIKDGNYEKIVTHNPNGEYGHIHHKMISKMVTEDADKEKLYYFGRFYKNSNLIPKDNKTIDDKLYTKKIDELISIYKSQPQITGNYGHMFLYENWVRYYDWNDISA